MMKKNAPIFYVGGSKGGVGKSMFTFALLEYLFTQQKKIFLLETDTANPDIFKAHQAHESENFICRTYDLDGANGWIKLVNMLSEFPEHFCIINAAARSNEGVQKYGKTLSETLDELEREIVTFWLINRQRDSVELLRIFMQNFTQKTLHVCRNLYFGTEDSFELYNDSKARELVEKNGETLNFPNLADRVADTIYSERIPLWEAQKIMPIGNRAELKRWQIIYTEMFQSILKERLEFYGNTKN